MTITFSRGSTSLRLFKAVRGSTPTEIIGTDGTVTQVDLADFLISRDQLLTMGEPVAGDVIVCNGVTFTVAHPDPSKKAVDNFGHDGQAFRVHTIQEKA